MANSTKRKEVELEVILKDIDELLTKLEKIDTSLSERIEQSTKDAVNKALLAANLNFKTMIDQQEIKLINAGHYAAAAVGNTLKENSALAIAANQKALENKAKRIYVITAIIAFLASMIGTYLAIRF